jgi:hypothetical protein
MREERTYISDILHRDKVTRGIRLEINKADIVILRDRKNTVASCVEL